MFERFSANARQVVVGAQEEARLLSHNYIGTEHLLLGLLRQPDSVGGRALNAVGVSLDDVRARVLATIGKGKKTTSGHIPFTPRAKKILELSLREALQLGHDYIGTEHIVLALVREGSGLAAQVLTAAGVELTELREVVNGMAPAGRPGEAGRLRRWFRSRPAPSSRPEDVRTTAAADVSLEEAHRLAGGGAIGSHHLLLAALSDPASAAAKALTNLGVDIDRAREALRTVDIAGTADDLPEEAGRRQLRMRLADDLLSLETSDPVLVEEARKAFEALGDPASSSSLDGGHAAAVRLADVWTAWRDALQDIARRAGGREDAAVRADPPA